MPDLSELSAGDFSTALCDGGCATGTGTFVALVLELWLWTDVPDELVVPELPLLCVSPFPSECEPLLL